MGPNLHLHSFSSQIFCVYNKDLSRMVSSLTYMTSHYNWWGSHHALPLFTSRASPLSHWFPVWISSLKPSLLRLCSYPIRQRVDLTPFVEHHPAHQTGLQDEESYNMILFSNCYILAMLGIELRSLHMLGYEGTALQTHMMYFQMPGACHEWYILWLPLTKFQNSLHRQPQILSTFSFCIVKILV